MFDPEVEKKKQAEKEATTGSNEDETDNSRKIKEAIEKQAKQQNSELWRKLNRQLNESRINEIVIF